MCVKFPLGDLNPNLYPSHPTSTYTCGVTIAPRVCGGKFCKLKCLCIIYIYIYIYFFLEWFCLFILLFVLKRRQTIFCMWKNMGHIRLMQLKRPRKGYRFGNPCRTTCYDPNSIQPKPKPNWPNSFSKSKKDMTF